MKIIIRLYAIGVFCQGTLADQQPTNDYADLDIITIVMLSVFLSAI